MNSPIPLQSIVCESCSDLRIIGPKEMANSLRSSGRLRRDAEPDLQLLLELYKQALAANSCVKCGGSSFVIAAYEMDEEDWGDPILCEVCKQEIPAERLEIFPNEKRCAGCKDKPLPGDADPEFCEACGGLMALRQRGGSGIASYVMACTDCGRKS